ncbi:3-hydroxyacyl-CoA dehydrogenase family protein [Nonomuraea sp. NPDC059023]|uniref:3-hydroxyacyl-CoA dehydrogenase family protein n=1 Tax=unclassified Nonomuraea TaxID=2593643 RepID=UPI00367A3938
MDTEQSAHRLTIIGAGTMGVGIATMAIGHGVPVVLVETGTLARDSAYTRVRQQTRHAQLLGGTPRGAAPAELTVTGELADGRHASAVIEAVTESAALKADVLGEVCGLVEPGTPLITNTSGIPIGELAATLKRPGDLLGTHFMNPPYLIRMVEVIRGERSDQAAMAATMALLSALGRQPVVVRDAPGFVTSRLLHPMINDAARVVGAGTATVEQVDALMHGCLGYPTGPLRTADLIGLDNLADSLTALYERTGDEGCRPCEVLLDKVRQGHLGRKSGRGFYDYGEALS